MKFASFILSSLVIATVCSISPPVHHLFDTVVRRQDNTDNLNDETATEQNGADDLAESNPSSSISSSTNPSNLLNQEPAALNSDVPLSLSNLGHQPQLCKMFKICI